MTESHVAQLLRILTQNFTLIMKNTDSKTAEMRISVCGNADLVSYFIFCVKNYRTSFLESLVIFFLLVMNIQRKFQVMILVQSSFEK